MVLKAQKEYNKTNINKEGRITSSLVKIVIHDSIDRRKWVRKNDHIE